MRYCPTLLLALGALVTPLSVSGQDLSPAQMDPWNALEKQIELAVAKDFEAEAEYIHPEAIWDGDDLPTPVKASRNQKYYENLMQHQNPILSYVLIPTTVTVVDDVAIINAYIKALVKAEEGVQEITYRLHNTWKKDGERWRLLATYNAAVGEPVVVGSGK